MNKNYYRCHFLFKKNHITYCEENQRRLEKKQWVMKIRGIILLRIELLSEFINGATGTGIVRMKFHLYSQLSTLNCPK